MIGQIMPLKSEKYTLGNGNRIICTRETVTTNNETYYEFLELTLSPDHFRMHYLSKRGIEIGPDKKVTSEKYFRDLKHMPPLLQQRLYVLMAEQLKISLEGDKTKQTL